MWERLHRYRKLDGTAQARFCRGKEALSPIESGLTRRMPEFGAKKAGATNLLVCKWAVKGHYIKFCDVAYDFKTSPATGTLFHLQ